MLKDPSAIHIQPCRWEDIQPAVTAYLRKKEVLVESYWEDHVLASRFYQLTHQGAPMGYFAIHEGSMLTLFHVDDVYVNLSQALFAVVRKQESVTSALVATGDEFFLCHCLDDYARLEKQGYAARYVKNPDEQGSSAKQKRSSPITLRQARFPVDTPTFALAQGFFDEDIPRLEEGFQALTLYIAEQKGDIVGFGAFQTGQILPEIASIGMYVCEEYRQQGVATTILGLLRGVAAQRGLVPVSGCWYYNHNSKKSQDAAGAACLSRYLRFTF